MQLDGSFTVMYVVRNYRPIAGTRRRPDRASRGPGQTPLPGPPVLFEHAGAAGHAEVARAAYTTAGHQVGLANISINEAEILAVTDPAAAVSVAAKVIDMQRQLGAEREVGKGLTALGLAHLGLGDLGDLDAAGQALDEAAAALTSTRNPRCRHS